MFTDTDIKKHIPIIINAYTKLFGEEYREIITQRANNLEYLIYDNFNHLDYYYKFLLRCKQRQLSIKFLDLIGIDTSKNSNKSFYYDLDEDLNQLVNQFIGDYSTGLGVLGKFNIYGVLSFTPENMKDEDCTENRIKFLNFIRTSSDSPITVDNIDEFYKTEEYSEIKQKIDFYIETYEAILEEYNSYKNKLAPYQKQINDSENFKYKIYDNKENKLKKSIYSMLPLRTKIHMFKNKISIDYIFQNCINLLEEKSDLEFFSNEDNLKLQDNDVDEYSKNNIYYYRKQFLGALGFDINSYSYDELIKKRNIRKLIPSEKVIKEINRLKNEKLEAAKKEYYYTKYDIYNKFTYDSIIMNSICISTFSDKNLEQFFSSLLFTLKVGDEGHLDYILLHEFCHQIELSILNNKIVTGFDINFDKNGTELNPYNNSKRKYERLNENIADIFAILALHIIRDENIYMLDEKDFTPNFNSHETLNTCVITKQLLRPFVLKYKKQIVKSRITGDSKYLFDKIGKENFENLNDCINKLDYLLCSKCISDINIDSLNLKNTDDLDLIEINNQIERIKQIYIDMDNYQNIFKSKCENMDTKNLNPILDDSEEIR